MKITTAMLADAAQVQGGKLYVLGGGFDTISTKQVPVVHRNLALALVAEVGPDERHRDLEMAITLMDEDGQPVGVEAKGKLRVGAPPNLPPGASSVVPMVSPFFNLKFDEAKGYAFVVEFEGDEIARVRFRIVLVD
ncbi:MAG: hypothetical protein KJN71_09855 [Acidimicrobiia bacterium]|nr:hypothetical protein [Acidimicrobiia bacterium]NNC76112.1 hypothetical protein [Acidimicrobiia bacterium]